MALPSDVEPITREGDALVCQVTEQGAFSGQSGTQPLEVSEQFAAVAAVATQPKPDSFP